MEMEEPCWREMVSQKALILIGSFFFFFLCFAFPLNFFKISLGMSLVLQWHVSYLENLSFFLFSSTSNFSTLHFFCSPVLLCLQDIIYTILSAVMEARGHIQSSVSLTECAEKGMGNLQPSALQRAKASLPPTACGRGKPLGEVWALVQFCSPVTLGQAPPFCTVSKYFFRRLPSEISRIWGGISA